MLPLVAVGRSEGAPADKWRRTRTAILVDAFRRDLILMADLVIEQEILIDAPVQVVWHTVTEPDQMTQWFADRVDLVVEPGAHGYMGFGDQGDCRSTDSLFVPLEPSEWGGTGGRQLDARRIHTYSRGRRPYASTGDRERSRIARLA